MDKAARIGAGIPKIGLIKRDLTKLGASREVAVVWRNDPVALWRHDQPTPEGYEPNQRIVKTACAEMPALRRDGDAGAQGHQCPRLRELAEVR